MSDDAPEEIYLHIDMDLADAGAAWDAATWDLYERFGKTKRYIRADLYEKLKLDCERLASDPCSDIRHEKDIIISALRKRIEELSSSNPSKGRVE